MKNVLRIVFVVLLTCAVLAAAAPAVLGGGGEISCFLQDPLPLCCSKVGGPQQVYSAICVSGGQVFRTTVCTGPCLL